MQPSDRKGCMAAQMSVYKNTEYIKREAPADAGAPLLNSVHPHSLSHRGLESESCDRCHNMHLNNARE